MAAGTWWIHARTLSDLRWAIEGRVPTRTDQRNAFLTPWRIAIAHLVLWLVGAALLTTLYGIYNPIFIPRFALP